MTRLENATEKATGGSSLPAATAGAAAGVVLVALIGVGWWLGGTGEAPEAGDEPASPAVTASPRAPGADVSPHPQGTSSAAGDAEVLRLREAVAADPTAAAPRRELALRLLQRGDFYAAFEEGQALLERQPDDIDGLFVVAAVRVRMGQPSRALPLLDKVLERAPDHVPALTARGQALLKAGHDAAAIEVWERALELSGGSNRQVEELLRSARDRDV